MIGTDTKEIDCMAGEAGFEPEIVVDDLDRDIFVAYKPRSG